MMMTHPEFIDVRMEVIKSFYIKEKDMWSLRVIWWNKRGWMLSSPCRIKIPNKKWKEFKKV